MPYLSRRSLLVAMAGSTLLPSCRTLNVKELVTRRHDTSKALSKIAMGSCLRQDQIQPVWQSIRNVQPDIFVHLGDNIYADTYHAFEMHSCYAQLWANAGYQALRRATPVVATWDDHDYGWNNSGAEYWMKKDARQIFCDFFGEPANSLRRVQPDGIYTSYIFGPSGQRTQIILLDGRYERTKSQMLGERQWQWLEGELRKSAELRFIASGSRVIAEGIGREEGWENIPEERQRLFALVGRTQAEGVMFLSGDPHYSDYSLINDGVPYPFWDMTSSALNQSSRRNRPNVRRKIGGYFNPNFGLISIDWAGANTLIRLETRSSDGKVKLGHAIPLRSLKQQKHV
tara:strand:+ start:1787 stop:2815 length:1029 start_codon:yes stop_codon:yes gene_type:complete